MKNKQASHKNLQPGNIPSDLNMIIIPLNLHAQFISELYKYLMPGIFNIFLYLFSTCTHMNFWDTVARFGIQMSVARRQKELYYYHLVLVLI